MKAIDFFKVLLLTAVAALCLVSFCFAQSVYVTELQNKDGVFYYKKKPYSGKVDSYFCTLADGNTAFFSKSDTENGRAKATSDVPGERRCGRLVSSMFLGRFDGDYSIQWNDCSSEKGYYKNNKLHGEYKEFDKAGKLMSVKTYENGEEVGKKVFSTPTAADAGVSTQVAAASQASAQPVAEQTAVEAQVSRTPIWNGTADAEWYWDNTEAKEYTITTAEQLAGLAQLVNGGNTMEGKTITLGANIALNDTSNWKEWGGESNKTAPANKWTPIGSYTDANNSRPFGGTFDGAGYKVSGVYINNRQATHQGLFGFVKGSTIKNLGVAASYVKANSWAGGLVGGASRNSAITNCYAAGNVYSETKGSGGLVGFNKGAITKCYAAGDVDGRDNAGGLVGWNVGAITDSYATMKRGFYTERFGGLVGWNGYEVTNPPETEFNFWEQKTYIIAPGKADSEIMRGTIKNCYATFVDSIKGLLVVKNEGGIITDCYVTGNLVNNNMSVNAAITESGKSKILTIRAEITNCYATGGWLVGVNSGTITNSYATGNNGGAGLVGTNQEGGTITNCYATGNVEGGGGLVRENYGAITNCYATGDVRKGYSSKRFAGGLVGTNYGSGTITNSYAAGNVEGGETAGGGLVGTNEGAITNCYAVGDVTGSEKIGGLAGENAGAITYCYSAGKVSGNPASTGGLVGFISGGKSAIANCVYDRQVSGQVDVNKGEPKSTAQMKQQAAFAGWDFAKIWAIDETKNNGYPFLRRFADAVK